MSKIGSHVWRLYSWLIIPGVRIDRISINTKMLFPHQCCLKNQDADCDSSNDIGEPMHSSKQTPTSSQDDEGYPHSGGIFSFSQSVEHSKASIVGCVHSDDEEAYQSPQNRSKHRMTARPSKIFQSNRSVRTHPADQCLEAHRDDPRK